MRMVKGLTALEYQKKWIKDHPEYGKNWRKKHPEYKLRQKLYYREWYKNNGRKRKQGYTKIVREWERKHPDARKARGIVRLAIKKGIIIKPNICEHCNRDNIRIEGHHPDYNKPLSVIWLCNSCHKTLHKNIAEK